MIIGMFFVSYSLFNVMLFSGAPAANRISHRELDWTVLKFDVWSEQYRNI